ncbi:hypothetical protein M0Q50_03730 [bacterium]|jgi:hypothetical protein|nr:hypothetical protein [bacterium]
MKHVKLFEAFNEGDNDKVIGAVYIPYLFDLVKKYNLYKNTESSNRKESAYIFINDTNEYRLVVITSWGDFYNGRITKEEYDELKKREINK